MRQTYTFNTYADGRNTFVISKSPKNAAKYTSVSEEILHKNDRKTHWLAPREIFTAYWRKKLGEQAHWQNQQREK